jgi:hypothetical protein
MKDGSKTQFVLFLSYFMLQVLKGRKQAGQLGEIPLAANS